MPANLLYAQSGGVTATINATASAVIATARRYPDRIGRVYAARNGIIGVLRDAARANGRNVPASLFGGVTDFHTTPAQAADEAREAGVRVLALTHFIPPVPMNPLLEDLFLGDARSRFPGPFLLAEDGDLVSLPAGSKDWSRRNLLE